MIWGYHYFWKHPFESSLWKKSQSLKLDCQRRPAELWDQVFFLATSWNPNRYPRFLPCLGFCLLWEDTQIPYSIYSRDVPADSCGTGERIQVNECQSIEKHYEILTRTMPPMATLKHRVSARFPKPHTLRGAREACPQRQHIRKEKRQSLVQNSNVRSRALALLSTFIIHLHSTHH